MADDSIRWKVCPRCHRSLQLSGEHFGRHNRTASGFRCHCKQCTRAMAASRYKTKRAVLNAAAMRRYTANRDRLRAENRTRYYKNAARYAGTSERWRAANPLKRKEYRARYYEKRRQAPEFRLARNIRWRLRDALKNGRRSERTLQIIGYSIDDLRVHLERQFTEGMDWSNYGAGGWHIDHIVPLIEFNHNVPTELAACWALSNLRPLWGAENLRKGAKCQFLL